MAAAKKKSKSTKMKSSNSTLTIIALIVVIGFGAYYSMTGSDVLGIFTPTETVPAPAEVEVESPAEPPVSNASSDWWEVYFADPININNPEAGGRAADLYSLAQTCKLLLECLAAGRLLDDGPQGRTNLFLDRRVQSPDEQGNAIRDAKSIGCHARNRRFSPRKALPGYSQVLDLAPRHAD